MLIIKDMCFSDFYKERRIKRDEKYKIINKKLIEEAKTQLDNYDYEILNVIRDLEIITFQHLLDLHESGYIIKNTNYKAIPKFFSKRINKLYSLGCVDCLYPLQTTGGKPKSIMKLYKMAPKVLNEKIQITSINRNYKHTLKISDVLVFLLKNSNVNYYRKNYKINYTINEKSKFIIPDLFAEYIYNNYNYITFFEIDLVTENYETLKNKIISYIDYIKSEEWIGDEQYQTIGHHYKRKNKKGLLIPKLILITIDEKRKIKIEKLLSKIDTTILVRNTMINFKINVCTFDNIKI